MNVELESPPITARAIGACYAAIYLVSNTADYNAAPWGTI